MQCTCITATRGIEPPMEWANLSVALERDSVALVRLFGLKKTCEQLLALLLVFPTIQRLLLSHLFIFALLLCTSMEIFFSRNAVLWKCFTNSGGVATCFSRNVVLFLFNPFFFFKKKIKHSFGMSKLLNLLHFSQPIELAWHPDNKRCGQ